MNSQFPEISDIHWLIDNGASMAATDRDGLTPLLRAMSWGNRDVIRNMMNHGADVNYAGGRTGITAMQIAASSGDTELVQSMLDAGGDVLTKNKMGISALDAARRNPKGGVLALIEAAARPLLEAQEAAVRHEKSLRDGLPVEKPFSPMKPIKFRPS
jgi:ankyrin repeat protein